MLIKELQKYPKALTEFCRWLCDKHVDRVSLEEDGIILYTKRLHTCSYLSEIELTGRAIKYLDSKHIYMVPTIDSAGIGTFAYDIKFGYKIDVVYGGIKQSREIAEAAGIAAGFEIINRDL